MNYHGFGRGISVGGVCKRLAVGCFVEDTHRDTAGLILNLGTHFREGWTGWLGRLL